MVEVEEYLHRAAQAASMMEAENDPQARAAFEKTAKIWLQLAEARMGAIAEDRKAAAASVVVNLRDKP